VSKGPDWLFLPFHALSTDQLYALLQLRQDVFAIEQNCLYPDLDGEDQAALHLMGFTPDGALCAYARVFPPGHFVRHEDETSPEPRISRIATRKEARGLGLGHALMREILMRIEQSFGTRAATMHAQAHLEKFYEGHGFSRAGNAFIADDGIPHIFMRRLV
jgi:ElaA protein